MRAMPVGTLSGRVERRAGHFRRFQCHTMAGRYIAANPECHEAGMPESLGGGIPRSRDAGMPGCRDAGMPGCRDAGMR
jgi:hypothetical protein